MVAKISVGKSLYGALAYNGEKINGAKGRLLTTNRIYNDGTGTVDIRKAMEGFLALLPEHTKVEKPVLHISLNPHPDDVLTDTELQDIAREYLEKLGYGNQPYLVCQARGHRPPPPAHRDDQRGRERQEAQPGFSSSAAATASAGNWNGSTDCIRQSVKIRDWKIRCARWTHRQAT